MIHEQSRRELIEALAHNARDWVGRAGTVKVDSEDENFILEILPSAADAAPVWVVATDWIDVQVGSSNSRWKLDYSTEGVRTVEEIVCAVIDGRSTEFRALGRAQVQVSLPTGHIRSGIGVQTSWRFLPAPGWRAWGKRQNFTSYTARSSI